MSNTDSSLIMDLGAELIITSNVSNDQVDELIVNKNDRIHSVIDELSKASIEFEELLTRITTELYSLISDVNELDSLHEFIKDALRTTEEKDFFLEYEKRKNSVGLKYVPKTMKERKRALDMKFNGRWFLIKEGFQKHLKSIYLSIQPQEERIEVLDIIPSDLYQEDSTTISHEHVSQEGSEDHLTSEMAKLNIDSSKSRSRKPTELFSFTPTSTKSSIKRKKHSQLPLKPFPVTNERLNTLSASSQ